MKAHQLYRNAFSKENLNLVFSEKILPSRSIGKDGTSAARFAGQIDNEIPRIIEKIMETRYEFTGYREKLLLRGAEKYPRQISIPTIRDKLVLRILCDLISEVFDDCITKPPHEYIKSIVKNVSNIGNEYSFVRLDIQNYYPSIDHAILLSKIKARIRKREILDLLMKAIKTPTGEKTPQKDINEKGVPQGLSISNILSSIYMKHIDKEFAKKYCYYRYVDDILVLCPNADATNIYARIVRKIEKTTKLKCHRMKSGTPGKTEIKAISSGIDYLGFHITDSSIEVRESSFKKMLKTISNLFTGFKYRKRERLLVWKLNLRISGCIVDDRSIGWMFFFRQTENISQLMRLDAFVLRLSKKYGLSSRTQDIKTFTKTYYEIRFRLAETKYIVNFDTFDLQQKVDLIILVTRKNVAAVQAMDPEEIDRRFSKIVRRETRELEKEALGFDS